MSLLGSIGSALKGAVKGFSSTGSPLGAIGGAAAGLAGGSGYKSAQAFGHGSGGQLAAQGGGLRQAAVMPPYAGAALALQPGGGGFGGGGASAVFPDWSPTGITSTVMQGYTTASGQTAPTVGATPSTGRYSCMYVLKSGRVKTGHWSMRSGVWKCVPNRRMNPLNPRAARRAIRRIRGVRKIASRIERALPKARHHAAVRRR
jgi:hypothetical protein